METYANPEQGVKKMNSKTKGDLSEARALEIGSQQTISLRIKAPENGQKNVK